MSDYTPETFGDLPLFASPAPIATIDPNVARADGRRLRGQNLAIFLRLQQGPATNRELSEISLKYTSRISDVRKWLEPAGYTIECAEGHSGLHQYMLARATQ